MKWFNFLLLSLLLHLIIGVILSNMQIPGKPDEISKQQVVLIDLPQPPQKIVDIAKPKTAAIPHKPSAEALYNQSVKEEQVAPQTGPNLVNKADQKKSKPKSETTPKEKPKKEKAADKTKPAEKVKAIDTDRTIQEKTETKPEEKIPGMPQNVPSRLGGDYLPSIKVGNTTYINTLANPNVAYFVELKHRFSLTWSPVRVLRPQIGRLPGGAIQVMMGVSVNATGELVRLNVLSPSGVEGYDEEAIRSVRVSAPFSSPPANLLENGVLNMAWTFIVNR